MKDVYLTEDYQFNRMDRIEFDAFILLARQMAEYQVIFDIFDSSIQSDNKVSKGEFLGSLDKLQLLRSSLKMTEDDFDAALAPGAKELSCQMFSDYLIRQNFVTVMNKSDLLLSIFNRKVNVRPNPLQKTLPVGFEPNEVMYRNNLFNQIDKNKSQVIRMQDTTDFFYLNKELTFLTEELKVLEEAYQTVKMLQFNSQEQLNRQEFDYLIIYLRQHFEFRRLFDHLDRPSRDQRVFQEEFSQGIKTLPMLGMPVKLTLDDFRRIKQRNNGYFSLSEFMSYMWHNNRTTIQDRDREIEEIQQMLAGTLGIERLNYIFPFGNSDSDL